MQYTDEEMKKLEQLNAKLKENIDQQEEKLNGKDIELKTLEQTIRQLELEKQML